MFIGCLAKIDGRTYRNHMVSGMVLIDAHIPIALDSAGEFEKKFFAKFPPKIFRQT